MPVLKGNGWKGWTVLQVEGMVTGRRTEAERSKSCARDGKISMPVATSLYKGVWKKGIFPFDANTHLNFTVGSKIVTSSSWCYDTRQIHSTV